MRAPYTIKRLKDDYRLMRPVPILDFDSTPFWESCVRGVLQFQSCRNCGRMRYPPAILCPGCNSLESEWKRVAGTGRIFSYAVYHHAFRPVFQGDLPYVVAIVELDEGIRMVSQIVDCDLQQVAIGERVQVTFRKVNESITLPFFRPVKP